MLTIAYITSRREPHIEWFLDSLARESEATPIEINPIIIDFYSTEPGRILKHWKFPALTWTSPKPTVWQGNQRLPSAHWWAVSNARNTALCLAPDGWIAFTDDRSVLQPGWLGCVKDAMDGNYAVFGSYQKAFDVIVKDGVICSYRNNPLGYDSRLLHLADPKTTITCKGAWCFGCASAFPVEWALQVNGYDEDCDGLSFEDVIFGCMLEKQGYELRFDPRMITFEDRTVDKLDTPFRRTDKGISPRDKSHAILNTVIHGGRHVAPNYFGEGGIRRLRESIVNGGTFPAVGIPEHDWFDGQPLKDMI